MGRLEAIRVRLAAATPGPWEVETDGDYDERRDQMYRWVSGISPVIDNAEFCDPQSEENAALIAHAPADLAALLAVAEAAMEWRQAERAWEDCYAEAEIHGRLEQVRAARIRLMDTLDALEAAS